MNKTYSPKPTDITHDWYLIDASRYTLGRLSSLLATRLIGKHKPQYAPHLEMGDNLVVINSEKVKITGNKLEDKVYYRHSGYPGGIKSRTLAEQQKLDPTEVIRHAVKGMLPKNRLQDDRLSRLKVYVGSDHPHSGQSPKPLGEQ